ncbi:hypothetical protein [Fodinicurvata sp. EGI_FJ10296]|uniref:hypothetical protein n=1 Tax=Fodinicurvata sp. EGI_FJ10296 TaxID=3231908 RepID=UPI003456F7AB
MVDFVHSDFYIVAVRPTQRQGSHWFFAEAVPQEIQIDRTHRGHGSEARNSRRRYAPEILKMIDAAERQVLAKGLRSVAFAGKPDCESEAPERLFKHGIDP